MPTALDHARAIADAVLDAGPMRHADNTRDAGTQAVLDVLHARGLWFLIEDQDADGVGLSETAQPVARDGG